MYILLCFSNAIHPCHVVPGPALELPLAHRPALHVHVHLHRLVQAAAARHEVAQGVPPWHLPPAETQPLSSDTEGRLPSMSAPAGLVCELFRFENQYECVTGTMPYLVGSDFSSRTPRPGRTSMRRGLAVCTVRAASPPRPAAPTVRHLDALLQVEQQWVTTQQAAFSELDTDASGSLDRQQACPRPLASEGLHHPRHAPPLGNYPCKEELIWYESRQRICSFDMPQFGLNALPKPNCGNVRQLTVTATCIVSCEKV